MAASTQDMKNIGEIPFIKQEQTKRETAHLLNSII